MAMRAPASARVHPHTELRGAPDLATRFGVKGAELCDFSWRCEQQGHPVPRTWLLPADALDEALTATADAAPGYPRLPSPEAAPARSQLRARTFAQATAPLLGTLPALPHSLVRSSVVWPGPGPRPPGMDITLFSDDPALGVRLWQGLHKAYAALCRRGRQPGPVRCGLLLTERIALRWEGTAYVHPGGTAVEFGIGGQEPVLAGSPHELAATGLIGPALAEQIFKGSADLAAASMPNLVEIEFLVDAESRFVPTQHRVLAPGPSGPAPFHTPAEVRGPVVDLRGRPRSTAVLDAALRPDAVVVLAARDDTAADLFSLLWAAAARPGAAHPAALVLTHDRGSHAGLRTHLRWLAAAMLPGTAHYYLPDRLVAPGARTGLAAADGVHARFEGSP
ncbi:hypothetical protein [Catellatospora sichuanensis]|uniref:hypothetical protein n=1 Tax=Catellatospora sichuanensis TaxID=1969805 RepID=UPI001181F36E|nr:hypothetical protein [Catellatospora sichuanensis]